MRSFWWIDGKAYPKPTTFKKRDYEKNHDICDDGDSDVIDVDEDADDDGVKEVDHNEKAD